MENPSINIKQLAKALNLSTSTISRAFRNNSDINPATKEKILEKAKELNYHPNLNASSLREKTTNTIAIVLPELANNFFSQAVKGIEQVTRAHQYHTLVYVTDSSYEKEQSIVENLLNGRVDGMIISATGEGKKNAHITNIIKKKIPLVFFDRVYDEYALPKIINNDYQSSYQATKDLIERGAEKIAFLVIDKEHSIGRKRLEGYLDALKESKISIDNQLIVECDNDREISFYIIENLIKKMKPDAILTAVERLAVVSYRVCHANNIRIPEEVKVIGFSSLEIADLLNPSLSTITQPAFKMGQKAAQQLFGILKSTHLEENFAPIELKSEIIHRESTRKI
jgi:LacI family transcriptional regulator